MSPAGMRVVGIPHEIRFALSRPLRFSKGAVQGRRPLGLPLPYRYGINFADDVSGIHEMLAESKCLGIDAHRKSE